MATDLAAGKVRIFFAAGVGGYRSSRWADVDATDTRLEGWLSAGLVQRTGPRGQTPPDRLPRSCCGGGA